MIHGAFDDDVVIGGILDVIVVVIESLIRRDRVDATVRWFVVASIRDDLRVMVIALVRC